MARRLTALLLAGLWWHSPPGLAGDNRLEAPSQVHIREQIEVHWALPAQARGLLEIRPQSGQGRRITYAYTQRNPQALIAPEQPGDYVLVLLVDRTVQASRPLTVVLPQAGLQAPPTAAAGASVEVVWSGPDSRGDRLTFAHRDGPAIRGASYQYVGSLRGQPGRLRAPADPGSYDVVYLSGNTVLARAPIQIGSVQASLRVPASVPAGAPVLVEWQGPGQDQDRITFAMRGGEPLRAASYRYVANHPAGRAPLTASETPGDYDVVYLSSDRVIGRAPVTVTPARIQLNADAEAPALSQFTVTWRGAGHQGDRILLQDAEGNTASYAYIDPNTDQVRMHAPSEAGAHQLVYRSRGGREMARQALQILPPPAAPGRLLVEQARAALGPDDAVAVILDASGSMLQRLDGVPRIAIARDTLTRLIADTLPAGSGFTLRVFGHREADSCRTDLEIPLAPLDPAHATGVIRAIQARNLARTPLGRAIELAASDLEGVVGQRLLIVLSDGEETCGGDPAAAIQALRDRGWDLRINIIGLAIDDPALAETFQAWAALGNGRYYSAADRDELASALALAANAPYRIIAMDSDQLIALGRPGEPLSLPAGNYRIHRAGDRATPVQVTAGQTTVVHLE